MLLNDDLVYKIVYCIAYAFNGFIVYTFMSTFFGSESLRVRKGTRDLCYIAYVVITSAVYLIWNIAIVNLVANVAGLIGLTLLYSSSKQEKITAAFYTYFFLFASEIVVYLLTGYNMIPVFEQGYYRDIFGAIICRVLSFICALLLKNFKALKNKQNVPAVLWFASVFVPLSTLIIQTIIIYFVANRYVLIISVCMVVLLNIVSFTLYEGLNKMYTDKMESALIEQERELYYNQCLIMQSSAEGVKKFRHDISNHLSAIYEMLENKSYDDAESYVGSLIDINKPVVVYSQSGNVIIDSILNFKLQQLSDMGTDISSEITIPKDLPLNAADMTTILSNMIDNAREALEKTDNKTYSISIVYTKGRLMIRQQNSFSGDVKVENGRLATLKKNAADHGYGLENIRETAEKYGGFFKTEHNGNVFTTDVLLYIKLTDDIKDKNMKTA